MDSSSPWTVRYVLLRKLSLQTGISRGELRRDSWDELVALADKPGRSAGPIIEADAT